jgi:hypothetical protein
MVLLLLPLALNSQDPPQDTIPMVDSTAAKIYILDEVNTVERLPDTIYLELKQQQKKLNEIIEKKRKK